MLENELVVKALILVVTCLIALVLQVVATKFVKRVFQLANVPRSSIIVNVVRSLIWFLALLSVLEPVFGVQPTAFVAALGVTSIAVSFGLQTTISNLISGLGIMLARVFEVGDWIEVGTYQGVATWWSSPTQCSTPPRCASSRRCLRARSPLGSTSTPRPTWWRSSATCGSQLKRR